MPVSDEDWRKHIVEVAGMKKDIDRIVGIVEGRNGDKGLKEIVTAHMSLWAGREEEKKIYDDRQDRKNNLIIALGILILALLTFFGIKAHLDSHGFLQGNSDVTSADYNIK